MADSVSVTVNVSPELRKAAMVRAITDDRKVASLVRDWLTQYAAGASKIEVYR